MANNRVVATLELDHVPRGILGLLEKIPASFWGVLAGGGITLTAVPSHNRASE